MTAAERNVLYHGSPKPLPERVPLRSGPLSMVFEAGDLRYVKVGGREVVRRICAAVRDRNWGTVPTVLSNLSIDRGEDSFVIAYDARHRQSEIDFAWHGRIVGEASGKISFTFDGVAQSTFLRNRIGLCVLHPDTCAGVKSRVTKVDESIEEGHFPRFIAPHQPFLGIRSIAHEVSSDIWAEVEFDGDEFEMEDQRNWIDGSFKTYGTPLRLPFPVEVREGTRIRQSVTASLKGKASTIAVMDDDGPVRVTIGTTTSPLPRLGLQMTPGHELTTREVMRLRDLNLSHLRVDIRLGEAKWETAWERAVAQAKALGVGLEVALFCTEDAPGQLASFVQVKPADVKIVRFLLHHAQTKTTPAELARLARETLSPAFRSVPTVGGTDAYFTELNRNRPETQLLDGVCYSANPQVHAFDNASLTECAAGLAATVESARQFAGDLPISITPVTLKPRFNPDATAPPPPPSAGVLPPQVDARQMSLYGACWTIASFKYLAESAIHSATYYETVGWRGVMERETGSPLPNVFRSVPGQVFPLYHMLADLGEFRCGNVMRTTSSDALFVESILIRRGTQYRLILANMTDADRELVISPAPHEAWLRVLDETTAHHANASPDQFRDGKGGDIHAIDGALQLKLKPYAIATIDAENWPLQP